MKRVVPAVLILVFSLLAGSSVVEGKKRDEGQALVFGSIHGVPGLKHVYIQKLGKVYIGRMNRPKTHVHDDGMFYFDNVPAGDYYLAGFSNGAGDLYWFRYTKKTIGNVLFNVPPGQVTYMGSYQASNVKSNFWTRQGKFDFERVDDPNERTLLEKLALLTTDTRWASEVGAKYASLSP